MKNMRQILVRSAGTLLVVLGVAFATAQPLAAASPTTQFAACTGRTLFGFPSWDACLSRNAAGEPQITRLEDVWLIIFPLIESMIKAAAYIAVIMIIWASILLIKSQGDPGKINEQRDTIRNAIIGLIICIASVAIVQFVANRF